MTTNKHNRYSSGSFREAVESRGSFLPTDINPLIGDLIGSIVRLNELEAGKYGTVSSKDLYEAGKAIDDYADKIKSKLLDPKSREIVNDEIFKLDDLDSDYIIKMYPEGFL